jgi:hypothetical protein
MKKLKVGFGEGGFQGFMARHVEKCVLGVVILLMAWFIYSGSDTKPLGSDNITQKSLQDTAQQAQAKIQTSSWTDVAPERKPGMDVSVIVNQQTKVDSAGYQGRTPWDPAPVPRLAPRTDPRILAAEHLVVTPLMGPLAVLPPETEEFPVDPLEKFESTLGGTGPGGMGGYGGSGAMPTPSSGYPTEETKGKKGSSKSGRGGSSSAATPPGYPGGYPGSESEKGKRRRGKNSEESSGESGYPSMPEYGGGTGVAQQRTIPPEATMGVQGQGIVRPSYAMVVNASVPFKSQWLAYQEAFSNAPGGQDPNRDTPQYLAVWVERADVTDDPEAPADKLTWKKLSTPSLRRMEATYGAMVNELSDPEALDQAITHPAPPFLLTNLIPALTHPDIPQASTLMETEEFEMEAEPLDENGFGLPDGLGGAMEGSAGPGGGYGPGRMGGGRMPGMMPGASGRMPRTGGPGMSGGMPGGSRRMGPGGASGSGGYPSYAGSSGGGRMPPGMGSGSGPGGMMGGAGGMDLSTYRVVSKKQVRFVDFDVQPERKYRYRVQLVMQDPNHPMDAVSAPEITSLDEKARERIKAIEAEDTKQSKARNREVRTYWVTSPWSEPSEIVSLPSPNRFYAGENTPSGTIRMNNVVIPTNEPQGKVVAVQWDSKLGVFAPAELTTHRGSALNTKSDVEVIHPMLGDLRKIPDYTLQTDALVLDMAGGEYLPGTDRNAPERAPGETLIIDAEGNLIVTDEAIDVEGPRKYIFPEPKEKPMAAAGPEGSSMEDAMAPPGYPGGYPGAPKAGRQRSGGRRGSSSSAGP